MKVRNTATGAFGPTSTLACAILGATLSMPVSVSADSLDYTALEELFGEAVTASATGSPQRESDVAATMTIITAQDIRRSGARDIPAILSHVAGIDVLHTSNDHADVSVRGYNQAFSPRLLVLVDGRQVYADYYGFTPWSTVPVELDAIRQIEIVKGPNSALFGFNAVGGVINIVTYDPLTDDVDSVALSAGTQDLGQVSVVSTWKPAESVGLRLTAGHRDGDDFGTALQPADVGSRRGNQRNAMSLDVEWDARNDLRVGLEATYSDVHQPEFSPVYTLAYTSYQQKSIRAKATADTRAGLFEATIYSNSISAAASDGEAPEAWLNLDNRVTVAQLQSISKIARNHTLRLSAEYRHNTMDTTPFPGGNVYYDVAAFGSMWEWRLDPSVTLTAAVRVDDWSLGRSGSLPAGYALSNDDWDRSLTEPSFNAGVVWRASDADTLRFLASRGVQLPNLFNLGGFLMPIPPVGFATGFPELDPTIVDNYEVSWDRALPGFGAKLRISAFHGQSQGVVAVSGDARPLQGLFGPGNIGDTRTNGLEVSLDGTVREDWRWGLSYSGQEIDDDFTPGIPVEITLTDFENTTPRHVLKGNVGWAPGRWEADAYLRYQSRFNGIVVGPMGPGTGLLVPISSYVSVDGRLSYAINDQLTLALSGRNLTRPQQRQTSAPDVERAVFATFAMDFGSRE